MIPKALTHDRKLAIERGLEFIYQTACEPENFEVYGFDYLGCFHCIASTSKNFKLRRAAREMGRKLAIRWRRENSKVPPDADAEDIVTLVFGGYAADSLGVRDDRIKAQLRKAAANFTAHDYFGFDAAIEPPPQDVPNECTCGTLNDRGRKTCSHCRKRLTMMSRYALWQDALIRSYMGERYGARLGTTYADAIKWLPVMRPYPNFGDLDQSEFNDTAYAVTHVVYTLNDYSRYRLSPRWLRFEYSFLKQNFERVIQMDHPETMGEFLDSLKSFGLAEDHPLVLKGVNYLLTKQNPDGSWGVTKAKDIYRRYHPTWTAVDGLREYAYRGTRLSFETGASVGNLIEPAILS